MKCLKCKEEISSESKFCPFCGQNQTIDNCPNCGKKPELDFLFCDNCGFRFGKQSIIEKSKILKVKKKRSFNNLSSWLMASIHSFVLLMLMIFIFLPLGNVKIHSMVGLLDLENVPDDMRFKYEIIDTIEVFSFVFKDNTYEDYITYIVDTMEKSLDNEILKNDYEDLTVTQKRKVKKAISKINPFYLYTIPEVREEMYVTLVLIMIFNTIILLGLIAYIVFLILSIINLSRRRNSNTTTKLNTWALITSLFIGLMVVYFNKHFNFKTSLAPKLSLIFSSLSFLTIIILKYTFNKSDFKLRFVIKKCVNIFIIVILLLLVNGASLRYKYTYKDQFEKEKNIVDSESIHKFINMFNRLVSPEFEPLDDEIYYSSIENQLNYNSKKYNKEILGLYVNSSLNFITRGMRQDAFVITPFAILTNVLYLSVVILLFFSLMKNIIDIENNEEKTRKNDNVIMGIAIGLWFLIIVSLIVLTLILNFNFDYYKTKHSVSIGIGVYFAVFVFAGYIVWNNIFKARKDYIY